MTNGTLAVVALATALLFQWTGWWAGSSAGGASVVPGVPVAAAGGGSVLGKMSPAKLNLGPRLGALALLLFGQLALSGGVVQSVVRWTVRLIGGWLGAFAGWAFNPGFGHSVSAAFPWLVTAVLALLWLAAFLPDSVVNGRMGWGLAWAGILLPASLPAIPGPGGDGLVAVFRFLTDLTRQAATQAVTG